MTASTISSLIPSRSILGTGAASVISALLPAGGEGGGVCSMAMALSDALSTCDLFSRLLGCDSGDAERSTDVEGVADDEEEVEGNEADEERAAALEAAAARAAC